MLLSLNKQLINLASNPLNHEKHISTKYLRTLCQNDKPVVIDTKKDIISQALKSKDSKSLQLPSVSRIKVTLQQAVLSGLRIRAISKSHPEYNELYHHTLKSVQFALRREINAQHLPKADKVQELVDEFLSLYDRHEE